MRVEPIACLSDNYAYLIEWGTPESPSKEAIVIDPSEAAPVAAALGRSGASLRAIFCTHHHLDHVGGVVALAAQYGTKPVYGHRSDAERIEGLTQPLADGDVVRVGSLELRVLHVPAHTRGAIAFVVRDLMTPDEAPWVFTGDTLFLAGCGRLFEGTPADMHRSLNVVLGALPGNTKVACGHEYTLSNLRFAAHVEPENRVISERIRYVEHLLSKGTPSVPGTITAERTTNPFMRVDEPAVRRHVALATEDASTLDSIEVLRRLREEKNTFR